MIMNNIFDHKIMKVKVLALTVLCNLILFTEAMPLSENKENLTLFAETAFNHTTKQIVVNKPIVIHTQLQNYDQPTLRDYQECHENLEKCKKACEGVENPVQCVQKCPVCPLLIKEKIVVQGINDTNISSVVTAAINTTNVIRLTNEIRNIIQTHQGNITNLNKNIVHVHQNTSIVGGKFGLGFNNTEPCCIVVSSSKRCDTKQFSTANRCHHKRQRVCGSKCKSRVMKAKRVTICENAVSEISNGDYDEATCYETVKYFPYQSNRKQSGRLRKRCSFTPSWPYVLCGRNEENQERLICRRCLDLPYIYILQRGLPAQCLRCFMTFASPGTEVYPQLWYSALTTGIDMIDNEFSFEDGLDSNMGDWHQVKTKCRLPNGTISENCDGDSDISLKDISYDPLENLSEVHDGYLEYDDYGENGGLGFKKSQRKRRQTFTRSKYSRRYRQ